jgi:hypothetical protein
MTSYYQFIKFANILSRYYGVIACAPAPHGGRAGASIGMYQVQDEAENAGSPQS